MRFYFLLLLVLGLCGCQSRSVDAVAAQAHVTLAYYMLEQQHIARAQLILRQAQQEDQQLPELWQAWAAYYGALGDWSSVRSSYQRAVQLAHGQTGPLLNDYAVLLCQARRWRQAFGCFAQSDQVVRSEQQQMFLHNAAWCRLRYQKTNATNQLPVKAVCPL